MERGKMTYGVVIPTRERATLLARALRSVYDQTREASVVVVVIDGGDSTGYEEVQALFGEARFVNTGGVGAAAARNVGIDRVLREGVEAVAFLDDDDAWLPRKMERQLEALESNRDLSCVSCGRLVRRAGDSVVETYAEETARGLIRFVNIASSFSFLVFPSRVLAEGQRITVGLPACQDWDLVLKAGQFGELGFVSEVLCDYHLHEGPRISGSFERRIAGHEAILRGHGGRWGQRTRWWHRGRLCLLRSLTERAGIRRLSLVLKGAGWCLASDCPLRWRLRLLGLELLRASAGEAAMNNLRARLQGRKVGGGGAEASPKPRDS